MRRTTVVLVALLGLALAACGDNKKPGTTDPDAAPPDGMETTEVVCETLPPTSNGETCEVSGSGATKVLKGIVLTPSTVYRGGRVAIDASGSITCVGCDCDDAGATVISCPDGAISPGLINTHDHITFTQNPPYSDNGERYEHRHQWRRGQDGHTEINAAGGASADQIRWGELRFLMGGATSIVGSGGQPGLLRNLDSANQEGLGQGQVNFDTFPLDDSGGTRRATDCNYNGTPTTAANIANDAAYEPHTSEGIDATARNEFLCQSSDTYDAMAPGTSNNLLIAKTAMIHAIGLQPADLGAMATAGTALIWSPRSNITLYGDTARVTTAHRLGVEIALGTDWMPTGSMNLLRELKCADSLNQTYYHYFTDAQLWQMVTTNAAAVTATDDVIGLLAPGKVADIAVFRANGGKTFRAVIDAEPQDVALVMRGGKTLYGDAGAVGTLGSGCDTVDVCGASKQVCLSSEVGKTYSALQTAAGASIYPAFTCGAPPSEPTCTPSRPTAVNGSTVYTGAPSATDDDGDGIANDADKCPSVFDPIRPVDDGAQGDADGDGTGDACDVCPLDANTTTCTVVDPNDRDHDGVANDVDNCPDDANADQADADDDNKGDVCDPCPNQPNPGSAGCAVTVYSIKNGTTPVGTTVRVENLIVTGRGSNGFFAQVKAGDPGDMGADFSGIFVFTGANAPTLANAVPGNRVTIDGRVANFFGQIELDTVSAVTVLATGEAPPTPVDTTYAEVKTGGSKALAYEGLLVRLPGATVSAINAQFGEFTLTAGADSLPVDDFLFVPSPTPTVGQTFSSVTGIMAFRNSAHKLEPRSAADLVSGPPALGTITPGLSFARVGTTVNASTFPSALTVTLTSPAQGNTTVTVTSSSADLSVFDVVIPDGQTSATVPVTAVAQNPSITVTAQLDAVTVSTNVRVLGTTEAPSNVTLSPSVASVPTGGTVQLTASLDIPALVDTTVDLTLDPTTAGSVPATVTIPANQLSASFTFTSNATLGPVTIDATLGGSTSSATVTTVPITVDHLVISQIYGAGGNAGSLFQNDFIELHNPTNAPIAVGGMSVQYASAAGSSWAITSLPSVSIPAGGYLLVAEAAGTNSAPALPTPDATGTIAMAAGAGKVALVEGTTALSGACPTAPNIIDLVGYGSTASCFEGAAPTAAPSATLSVQRQNGGCLDEDQNASDFDTLAPVPRNSATTPVPCS